MKRAWDDRLNLIHEMWVTLKGRSLQYDGIVVSGVSGLVVGPQLAGLLGKHLAYVRKYNELTKNDSAVQGFVGDRWVFVDDFVSSGRTFANVCADVRKLNRKTTCVGILQYVPKVTFTPIQRAWDLRWSWNLVGMKAADIPGFVETKREVVAL